MDNRDEERLKLAVESSRLGLWDWNMVTGETVFNERWAEIIGYTLAELEPTTIETWMSHAHHDDLARSEEAIAAHIQGDTEFYDISVRMKHRDGSVVWVQDRGRVVEWGEDGTPLRMTGTHEDITERLDREFTCKDALAIFENSLEGIVILDRNHVIRSANPAFTALTGWMASEVVGTSFNDIRSHADDPAESERLQADLRSASGVRTLRNIVRPDGSWIPVQLSFHRELGQHGGITKFIVQISDMRQRIEAEAVQVERALTLDPATNLLNASGLKQALILDGTEVDAPTGKRALMMFKITNLGGIQEAFGYDGTERVLQLIAQRVSNSLDDTYRLARTGRDEFAIVCPNATRGDGAPERAQAIMDAASGVYQVSGLGDVLPTFSAGVAFESDEVDSVGVMLSQAAAALQIASRGNAGSLHVYSGDEALNTRERVNLVADMRRGWEAGEFRLAYQPINAVGTGDLVGVEALMRWDSPKHGPVPPDQFIPLAEESGLIIDLGAWAIQEATAECARFRSAGLQIDVAVNVTAQQMRSDGFVTLVEQALEESDLPGRALILEMTESTFFAPSRLTIGILNRLEELGVRISLDDFGTGYSSFSSLRQFNLDRLKIDRSFVHGIDERPEALSVIKGIVNLGHDLDMQVVAEGVETETQLDMLSEMKCDFFQGFVTSPAVDPSTIIQMAKGAQAPHTSATDSCNQPKRLPAAR